MAEALIEAHDASNHKDCADEIERLQKWQLEALALFDRVNNCQIGAINSEIIDRLIADAQEVKE